MKQLGESYLEGIPGSANRTQTHPKLSPSSLVQCKHLFLFVILMFSCSSIFAFDFGEALKKLDAIVKELPKGKDAIEQSHNDQIPRAVIQKEEENSRNTVSVQIAQPKAVTSDASNLVNNIQDKLNQLGYDAGVADGVFGAKTRRAIMAFERDQGLQLTGAVSSKLNKELDIALLSPNDNAPSGLSKHRTQTRYPSQIAAPPSSPAGVAKDHTSQAKNKKTLYADLENKEVNSNYKFGNKQEHQKLIKFIRVYETSVVTYEMDCGYGMTRNEAKNDLSQFLLELYPEEREKREWALANLESSINKKISRYKQNPVKNCLPRRAVDGKRIETLKPRVKKAILSEILASTPIRAKAKIDSALPTKRFSGEIPAVECHGKRVNKNDMRRLPGIYAQTDDYANRCASNNNKYYYNEMLALIDKYGSVKNKFFQHNIQKFIKNYGGAERDSKLVNCNQLKKYVFGKNLNLKANEARKEFICLAEYILADSQSKEIEANKKNMTPKGHAALPESVRRKQYEIESEKYLEKCNNNGIFNKYHDCQCLADRFVKYRMENGPETSINKVAHELNSNNWKQCIDQDSAHRKLKNDCGPLLTVAISMKQVASSNVERVCDCYATQVLKNAYESNLKEDPFSNFESLRKLSTRPLSNCSAKYGK